jgi:hypothetical protein
MIELAQALPHFCEPADEHSGSITEGNLFTSFQLSTYHERSCITESDKYNRQEISFTALEIIAINMLFV